MKKQLLLTLEFPPMIGGVATYLSELFRHFPAGSLRVVAPHGQEAHYAHPITRISFYYKKFWPRWLKALLVVRIIAKNENIGRIFISHALPMGYVAYFIKIAQGIPYVVFCHGMDVRLAAAKSWKRFWLKQILNNAELIIANSEYTKQEIQKTLKDPRFLIEVIQPSPKLFTAEKPQVREFMALSVARLVPRKGLDLAIAAFARISKELPEIKYYIIGDGPERGRLKQQIESLGLEDSVRLLGVVPDATLRDYYGRASIFLFPVRELGADVEGFGIAPLEASAHGIPVIASRSGGVSEAVSDGVTGILIPSGNIDAIVEIALFLLKNPPLAKNMGESGKIWAARFHPEIQSKKLISLLSR